MGRVVEPIPFGMSVVSVAEDGSLCIALIEPENGARVTLLKCSIDAGLALIAGISEAIRNGVDLSQE